MTTTPCPTSSKKPSKHPAKFSDSILEKVKTLVDPGWRVLDPFAGTGRVHEIDALTTGVEIEPEWASIHPRTIVGDALALPFVAESFDCVFTSPTYGNRMADHHDAKDDSRRMTYRHTLGRALHPNNSGQLQWGPKYRDFHERAWLEAIRVLKPGGMFILNISDHIRKGKIVPVSEWHAGFLQRHLLYVDVRAIPTPRLRYGANASVRVQYETVWRFQKQDLHDL